jgi:DNA-binding ferritin-like protein
MTVRSLEQYPRLKTLLNRCETERRMLRFDSQREEDLIQQIEHTLKQLEARGEPVTLKQIRQMAKLTQKQLRCSPPLKALLAPYVETWQGEAS